jgi:hypothetical protein
METETNFQTDNSFDSFQGLLSESVDFQTDDSVDLQLDDAVDFQTDDSDDFQPDDSIQNLIAEPTDSNSYNSVQELMGDIAQGYKKTLEESKVQGWDELQKSRLSALEGKNFSLMPWSEVLEILSGKWDPPPPPPPLVVEPKPKRTRKTAAKKTPEPAVLRLTPATMPWGEMLKILAGKATLAELTEEDVDKATESLKNIDAKDKWKNNATRSPVESIDEFIGGFTFE